MLPKDFSDIYKKLSNQNPPDRFFFCGDSTYMKEIIIRGLKKSVGDFRDFNLDVFWMNDKPDFKAILDSILQYPMLGTTRLVILRNFNPEGSIEKKFIQTFDEIRWSESTIMVVESAKKPDSRSKIGNAIKQIFNIYDFSIPNDREMVQWVNYFAKRIKKKIPPKAAQELIKQAGVTLMTLRVEIIKLSIFAENDIISFEDVQEVVAHSRSAHIFQFSNSFLAFNFPDACKLAMELLDYGESYSTILAFMRINLSDLLWAKISPEKLTKKLGKRSFLAKKFIEFSNRTTTEKLLRAIKSLHEADIMVKSGLSDEKTVTAWVLGNVQMILQ